MRGNNEEYHKLMSSYRWRMLRLHYLTKHPLCEECEKRGITRQASEVHHVIPIESVVDIAKMRQLAYDWNNLKALCHECHKAIHLGKTSEACEEAKSFIRRWIHSPGG